MYVFSRMHVKCGLGFKVWQLPSVGSGYSPSCLSVGVGDTSMGVPFRLSFIVAIHFELVKCED